jgi:copper chaperone
MILSIPDMNCGHCMDMVQRTISATDKHARVDIDLGTRKVEVETLASIGLVLAALAAEGYPAEVLEAA